jgi:hypothetical protein
MRTVQDKNLLVNTHFVRTGAGFNAVAELASPAAQMPDRYFFFNQG